MQRVSCQHIYLMYPTCLKLLFSGRDPPFPSSRTTNRILRSLMHLFTVTEQGKPTRSVECVCVFSRLLLLYSLLLLPHVEYERLLRSSPPCGQYTLQGLERPWFGVRLCNNTVFRSMHEKDSSCVWDECCL